MPTMPKDGEFEQWWSTYPRKIGKLAAEKEYQKARKRASAQELIEGVDRYLRIKPEYADYCHPRTWLAQGRWLDEEPGERYRDLASACPHVPKCKSWYDCDINTRLGRIVTR